MSNTNSPATNSTSSNASFPVSEAATYADLSDAERAQFNTAAAAVTARVEAAAAVALPEGVVVDASMSDDELFDVLGAAVEAVAAQDEADQATE